MSEEKKILEEQDTNEVPAPPKKKRGRKKKEDTAPVSASVETSEEKTDAATEEKAPEAEETGISDKESDNADSDDAAVNSTDEPLEAEKTIDAVISDSEASEKIEDNTEEDQTQSVESDGAPQTDDEASREDTTDNEDAYANIEHFSDTYEIKYLSDEVEPAIESVKVEEPLADAEYENLKIFEDTAPTVKREPKQKRVREISPDYKEYDEEKPRHVDARFDFIELFVYTLVVIMLITTFFFKHSEVSGWSMKGTLSDRDHVLISDFLYEPKQYDIVVVHDPSALEEAVVKRIIALGGQTVRLEYTLVKEKSNMSAYYSLSVFVDGEKVPDEYCYCDGADYSLYSLNTAHKLKGVKLDSENIERYEQLTFEYVVPDGEIYVMGDHRNDSTDSRSFGSVNENKILGRLILRFFPFDSFGTVD